MKMAHSTTREVFRSDIKGRLPFRLIQYPLVKQVFDAFADQDNYVIALRSVEAR